MYQPVPNVPIGLAPHSLTTSCRVDGNAFLSDLDSLEIMGPALLSTLVLLCFLPALDIVLSATFQLNHMPTLAITTYNCPRHSLTQDRLR